jgi:RNA polymerase sigma-70 factor, ECF subfamily
MQVPGASRFHLAGPVFQFRPPLGMTIFMNRAPSAVHELTPLLRAIASGDRSALSALYQRTSAKLYGIILRLLRSEGDAEEVLQEVFLTIWRNAGRFDEKRASPITWLGILARNRAIDRLRRARLDTAPIEAAFDIALDEPSALDRLEAAQNAGRLRNCLEELEGRPRAMIEAAFLDGMTYSELAEREGVPLGTMKSWIRRGLQRLKGCLER